MTTRLAVVVCTRLPLVPLMVSVELPPGVEADVVTVKVEAPDPLMEAGLKLAVAPAGKPLTLNATVPVKPLVGDIVTV